ncbi:tryptophan halogenase, putative [Cellvibrio sp. BR]|uniref:tryptophan halogenase family protein n=1 Tax=Cellvibrio sp. BR TaxID=1134474 RepID=UPI0002600E95|nr:tryptophan halogenase family protein [Cellvibrio sp. BR]EIK42887.1 tryptophan halogenase, putative [Cellvibrio sp. BR]
MDKLLRIVILGGGTAGWMAANLFAKRWPREQVQITLMESPEIPIIGVGEGSTPSLKRFFKQLDLPEQEWMPACHATYKTNIRFVGWSPASGMQEYSHPFYSQPDVFNERAFFTNCRTRRLGLDVVTDPEKFFINGELARQGKVPTASANFPFQMEYGYHFDSQLLGRYLAGVATARGVIHHQAKLAEVLRNDRGEITALQTDGGDLLAGDFFIDCTGFASLLMQKALAVPFHSYQQQLFNDSAVVMPTPAFENPPVETRSTALSAGWCWQIPLTHRTGNGYVYSSQFISRDQAEAEFRAHIGMSESAQECRHLTMRVGQLAQHWSHNCVGLGLSQGFIEPLEATALHLVQLTIEALMDALDENNFTSNGRDNFNRTVANHFDGVRDYIIAHYKLNTRGVNNSLGSDYWRANRDNKQLPESLLQILDVWYRCGDLAAELAQRKIKPAFNTASWHCLLAGYGAFPPLAANQPGQGKGDLYRECEVKKFVEGCALNFPLQTDMIKMAR